MWYVPATPKCTSGDTMLVPHLPETKLTLSLVLVRTSISIVLVPPLQFLGQVDQSQITWQTQKFRHPLTEPPRMQIIRNQWTLVISSTIVSHLHGQKRSWFQMRWTNIHFLLVDYSIQITTNLLWGWWLLPQGMEEKSRFSRILDAQLVFNFEIKKWIMIKYKNHKLLPLLVF